MTFTKAVVGVDGSPESADALRWALHEAKRRNLPVHATAVWYSPGGPEETEKLAPLRSRLVDDLASRVREVVDTAGATDVEVVSRVAYGHPAEQLIREAGDDALLVVGTRGRGGVNAAMFGSVSHSCAQYARSAVVVVRGNWRQDHAGRVVVGVDGSPDAVAALRFADDTAVIRGASLHVVHAWTLPYLAITAPVGLIPPDDVEAIEAQARRRLRESLRHGGVDPARSDVDVALVEGFPEAALLAAAEEADLLVVGTRGIGGWKGLLLGSVSMRCLTNAACPVVVTRHHPTDHLRKPEIHSGEDREHDRAEEHVVEVRDDEVAVGDVPVDR